MERKPYSKTARRGVLLLVVLSLLVMFGLIAITYLVITNQARRTAQTFERIDQYSDPPELELHQAAMQVIRGTRNPNSAIGLHSLLEDMYGGETVNYIPHLTAGHWTFPAATRCHGQFVALPAPGDDDLSLQDKLRRIGCVLTINTGVCAGYSTRIVSFERSAASDPATDPDYFLVMAFPRQTANTANGSPVYINGSQLNAGSYLINGVPFSGTGLGFNPTSGQNDLTNNNGWHFALLPRPFLNAQEYRTYAAGADGIYGTADDGGLILPGADGALGTSDDVHILLDHPFFLSVEDRNRFLYGPDGYADNPPGHPSADDFPAGTRFATSIQANEDYDAADFQNMLPAMIVTTTGGGNETANVVSPSLHRPELINYWAHQGAFPLDLQRRISLRPLPEDHYQDTNHNGQWDAGEPYFTGSNPAYNAINGPWDVDNDHDGVMDSIWVDLGAPVRSASDGRLFKPLYAILLQDLDSRVNVNAHGSTAQLAGAYTTTVAGPYANAAGQATPTVPLPRGEGYGPADVNLTQLLPAAQVTNLLRGSAALAMEGRYGENTAGTAEAGVTGYDNTLGLIKQFEFPADFSAFATDGLTSFGSPPDLWGRGCLGLDHRGHPFYQRPAWTGERLNNPYWLNLSAKLPRVARNAGTTTDNPFTVAELERVLRQFDGDAGTLATRLASLAPNLLYANGGRRYAEVTVESNGLPIPGGNTGWAISPSGFSHGRSIGELLRQRIITEQGLPATLTAAQENAVFQSMSSLLAWELILNRRFNLNRPLGNGHDSNANYVVDEVGEATLEAGWGTAFSTTAFQLSNGLEVNGVGPVNASDQVLARQLYARHLFVMALLLVDLDYLNLAAPQHYSQDPTADANVPAYLDANLTADQQRELTVRRIAQWAVNVVDFRDADSAMTPFEYVLNPFSANGWNVDGNVSTDEAASGTNPDRRVVWGCEYPEVLLTETLAFHDRRVADTAFESATGATRSDPSDPDDTLDQPRIPQGSAFFELYCTRNPVHITTGPALSATNNNMVAPVDLYTYDSTTTKKWYLNLAMLAPAGSDGLKYPVWRLVVTQTTNTTDRENDVLGRFGAEATFSRPYSFTPDPSKPSLLGTAPTDVKPMTIDRIVWFNHQAPAKFNPSGGAHHENWNRIFYNHASTCLLEPGRYALVGPRPQTWVGSKRDSAVPKTLGTHADQGIALNPVGVVADSYTYPSTSTDIQVPLGIVAAADPPPGWANTTETAPTGIGINISEPLPYSSEDSLASNYYPEPTSDNSSTGIMDAYGNLTQDPTSTDFFRDLPLDSQDGMPLKDEALLNTGTTTNYKTVLLQRLADPLQAYNATTNPYLTVDWMPIDLTVFNGEDRAPASFVGQWDPDDTNPDAGSNVRFEPRRRGTTTMAANLWYPVTTGPNTTTVTAPAVGATITPNFRHYLNESTLGYVNGTYGIPWSTTHTPAAPTEYVGVPCNSASHQPSPFPWLTWNNRPFANPLEVLLVPSSHPGRLCREFGLYTNTYGAAGTDNPYDGQLAPLNSPYSHLLNFFGSEAVTAAGGSPQLYRLLDYLETPSRFVGTETVLSPDVFGDAANTAGAFFRPPFNMVSEYRDPGRININMITGVYNTAANTLTSRVWDALLNGHAGPSFANLVASRRGFLAAPGGNWWDAVNSTGTYYPTRFTNPFRSASGAVMVTPPVTAQAHAVNATLLRAVDSAANGTPEGQSVPLCAATNMAPYLNYERNAYFRYESLARLSNLVTTRSNTYALWITVGYFQVEPWAAGIDAAHPDGFQLGQEVGADTGEAQRHRAFYIIDRTIPVGFQRGVDLNAENTVLLKRFIE